jgi:hypothetical protein
MKMARAKNMFFLFIAALSFPNVSIGNPAFMRLQSDLETELCFIIAPVPPTVLLMPQFPFVVLERRGSKGQ